jgi:hypothetical protein
MIIVRLLSPGPWLVGTTKVYSGVGADIVMESISLIDPHWGKVVSVIAMLRQLSRHVVKEYPFDVIDCPDRETHSVT